MARPPRTRIRKPGDRQPVAEPDNESNQAPKPSPKAEIDRSGAVQSMRRAPRTPRDESAPAPRERQELDLSGLEALAQMDRADLASLLDAQPLQRALEIGDKITATISRVSRENLFLDVGLKAEARMDRTELPEAAAGDEVEAWVVWTDGVEAVLSTRLRGETAAAFVDQAMEAEIPVQGIIESRNAGGFVVSLGGVRAFCPARLIDRHSFGDPDAYLGREESFLVIETGDKIVVSRRALQERELEGEVERRWSTLAEGDTLHGVVTGVQPFGIFVDCDGLEGLVPRSEATWERGVDLAATFTIGQQVEVRVLDFDREQRKLTFSVKDPGSSPWARVGVDFVEGQLYTGTVEGVEDYGAFIRLAPGITGLLHRSTVQGALPAAGESMEVRLLSVDHGRRRLELGPPSAEAKDRAVGEDVEGTVVEVLRNGVVLSLSDGRTGWLPEREADLPAGTILAQRFRRGRVIKARVAEIDDRRDRVTLTQRADTEAEAARAWRAHSSSTDEAGFGTLGDLLGKWKK